jgi:hypothetical protein
MLRDPLCAGPFLNLGLDYLELLLRSRPRTIRSVTVT